ncbi:hypothetical protein [Methylocystis echinoides]|nr:hypothetical protein [Methylocystis echinoides]
MQFEIVGPGGSAMSAEIYRRQFLLGSQQLAVQSNVYGGGGGGGGGGISGVTGSAQANSQLNNSNQTTFSGPVTVSGSNNNIYLNTGPQNGGSQTSTGTNQGSTNSQSTGGTQSLAGTQSATNSGSGNIVQAGAVTAKKTDGNYLNTGP